MSRGVTMLLLLLSSGCTWSRTPKDPSDAEAVPHLVPRLLTLGDVLCGSRTFFDLQLVNPSPDAVRIASVQASCDCTTTTTGTVGRVVEASGSTVIDFTLLAPGVLGDRSQSVTVQLGDGRTLESRVVWRAVARHETTPSLIEAGNVNLFSGENVFHFVRWWSEHQVTIKGAARSDVPWLSVATRLTDESSAELTICIDPRRLELGQNVGRIVVPTDDQSRPNAVVPVTANGVQDVVSYPGQLTLVVGETKLVRCADQAGHPVVLKSAASDNAAMLVELSGQSEVSVSPADTIPENAIAARVVVQDVSGYRGSFRVFVHRN
ncbi:hypothetical protein RAS1_43410 [Phycisphaerae bacterium RAS1]|nr:hypothetical protein RAS1_43410 [Phycisphaerae bacterium RAS1]